MAEVGGNIVLLLRQTVSYHNREQLQETFRSYRDRHDRHLNRLQELEQVRRQFKNRQFDGANSTFSNGAVIGAVLNEFLRGMATSPELWSTIQRQQQPCWTVSDPNFGSGGVSGNFGGAWRTTIPMPVNFPRGGGSGMVAGVSVGVGSEGFRTGGGF